jgi:polygalacturonase
MLSAILWACAFAALGGVAHSHCVDDFGAVANVDSWKIAAHNSDVLLKTILAANSSVSDDRTVVFPQGTYYLANSTLSDLYGVHIVIQGVVRFSDEINSYPTEEGSRMDGLWLFQNCIGITLTGTGTIDGQGLKWWRYAYTGTDNRPRMIRFNTVKDITITGLTFLNSPSWFLNLEDCRDILISYITIYTDPAVTRLTGDSVTYALNTDGIDLAAHNATVHHCNITNYDDAIVAKPCKSTGVYCTCSGSILAHDNTIAYSTGLTIGSVPPNDNINCVRNVTFRDTTMYRPLKAIYIKVSVGN